MVGRFFRSVEDDKEAAPAVGDVLRGEDSKPEPQANGQAAGPAEVLKPAAANSKLPDFVAVRVNLHRYLLDKLILVILVTLERD